MARKLSKPGRWTAVFLAFAYGLGAPVTVFLELRAELFSQRFLVPPALIYVTGLAQLLCAFGVLSARHRRAAAVVLTVTTVGAAGAHFRIGSPLTSLPALAFTALQVWLVLSSPPGDRPVGGA